MRLLISFALASVAPFALIACNPADSPTRMASSSTPAPAATTAKPNATPSQKLPADGVRRITTAELQELLSNGQAFVVDVRNEESYKLGHIPGAKLIPHTEVAGRSKEVPRDKTIVTYCS
ncbi:MAG: rhodanese-like domain-containing protein [Acidobacteriota bacterium]|nr:rhodanese-like domain-containing protein [Acidobacteriota bacterium]